ncbi:Uma2 family endonuclease [Streptomyces sp. NPDC059489]|uniref:Uma2 family endonuclease n=1 Tax=Streptomyces sp. NPDC059489 TaxID=3346849 RepID=UPI0036A11B22
MEIVSPSTRVTDRKMKPALYATAGIPRYWRMNWNQPRACPAGPGTAAAATPTTP